jgi:hypothetical protein
MEQPRITRLPTSALAANPANVRTHNRKQVAEIARSIKRFGFNNPILVDQRGNVVAGHGRLLAAQHLGLDSVPTIRLDHLSSAQLRAYAIADNRLAELSGWDKELLALEMQSLLDLDIDITELGFEVAEIDQILEVGSADQDDGDDQDYLPDPDEVPRISRVGDLWQAGRHLIFCGDALDPSSYKALLGSEKAHVVFTDPPYNVRINGHVSGLGKVSHREFVQASGELSNEAFREFLHLACSQMHSTSVEGAIHFICMDWRHIDQLIAVGGSIYSELKNLCVWVKPNGGMGSLYRSRHELVAVFKSGGGQHRNNVRLGAHGRYRTNVWEYDGMNSFQAGREDKLAMHPTVKPVGMIGDAILDCSARGDIVLDPFVGSGSTLLAAEWTGRTCRAIELDPAYVDVTLCRYAKATSQVPVNLWTGEPYEPIPGDVLAARCGRSE